MTGLPALALGECARLRGRKAVECCKWGFLGHPSRSLEDIGAASHVDPGGPAQEVSEGNISNWARDHFCDIFAKNVAASSLYPEKSPEAKLKSNGLISLVEEVSRQPNIGCHVVVSNHSWADLQ